MATYTNNLRLKEITTGDEDGTWGTSTNNNLDLIAESLGYSTQDGFASDADATTTVADGTTDPARALYFKVTSSATLTATRTLTIAPNTISRVMFIENATTGSQSIAISQGSGSNVTVPNGNSKLIYLDGAGATAAVVDITSTASLANLTLASGSTVTSILDEDGMGSDSNTALATQQSIKAYVDANTGSSTLADTLAAGDSTSGNNIVVTSGDSITTNTISETTAASGVTIDGLLIKDTAISFDSGSNYLDDYEEGTFTFYLEDYPGGNIIGLDNATGFYTKVGRLVQISLLIDVNSLGAATGIIKVQDLPFKVGDIAYSNQFGSAYCGFASGLAITSGSYVVGDLAESITTMNLYVWDGTSGPSGLTATELTANGRLQMVSTYWTSAQE